MPATSIDTTPKLPKLDDSIGFLLRRAYQRASSTLAELIQPFDLTVPQFVTIVRLREAGVVSQNRLGRLVAMEPANIRDVVRRLSERGLIATERDAKDARLVLVRLTDEGEALATRVLPFEYQVRERVLASLGGDERSELARLLGRIGGG